MNVFTAARNVFLFFICVGVSARSLAQQTVLTVRKENATPLNVIFILTDEALK